MGVLLLTHVSYADLRFYRLLLFIEHILAGPKMKRYVFTNNSKFRTPHPGGRKKKVGSEPKMAEISPSGPVKGRAVGGGKFDRWVEGTGKEKG